jgi:hypothetical protein
VVLEFVDGPVDEPVIDTSATYMDADRRIVRSTTGQLAWDHSGRGFITVDTPGTKAMIGHGGGRTHTLGEVTIAPQTPYCLVYVTAPGKDDTIVDAPSLLISVTARMVDRGTVFDDLSDRPLVAAPQPRRPPPQDARFRRLERRAHSAFRNAPRV